MWKSRDEYMEKDERGRWKNKEFPPVSYTLYPRNNGYENPNEEYLFYQFAVMLYRLRIEYKNDVYFAFFEGIEAYITDSNFEIISETYPTGNDLIKNFVFPDGRNLIELVREDKDIYIDMG